MQDSTKGFVAPLLLTASVLTGVAFSRHEMGSAPKYGLGEADAAQRSRIEDAYCNLPLSFEVNQGQAAGEVDFISRGHGYTLFATSTEAVLALSLYDTPRPREMDPNESQGPTPELVKKAAVRLRLVGADGRAHSEGEHELAGKSNYLRGDNPAAWQTDVPRYAQVRSKNVYPGIDWVLHGSSQGQLEYDFIVAPEADARSIRLGFDGVRSIAPNKEGDLILDTPVGSVLQRKPVAYQELDGERRPIAVGFRMAEDKTVTFELGSHDASRTLVIDPVLQYSTYLGGQGVGRQPGYDVAEAIAVDREGNAYVTGYSASDDFPTLRAFQPHFADGPIPYDTDVFVTKLAASGNALLYSTFLGGRARGGLNVSERGLAIAVDEQGRVYIAGETGSSDFPVSNAVQPTLGGYRDAFVSVLNSRGSDLVYSTYLGGSHVETANAIAVDRQGDAYVAGVTGSLDFPVVSPLQPILKGAYDAFVLKLDPTGAIAFSTYLGGSRGDSARAISVDRFGSAYVGGGTASADFPTLRAFQKRFGGALESDGFVARLNPTGHALLFSSFLGGSGPDDVTGLALGDDRNVYLTGSTYSVDFPTLRAFDSTCGSDGECNAAGNPPSARPDAFLTKLTPTGVRILYSTYVGGGGWDQALGIAVHGKEASIAGVTSSADFPTSHALYLARPTRLTPADAFVTRMDDSGSRVLFSTYLGGRGYDEAKGVAVDRFNNVYVAGSTRSQDFPTARAFQLHLNARPDASGQDAFVTKMNIDQRDTTRRIAYWPGKVNQHMTEGGFLTDPDGASGSNIDKLEYCQKWYPRTTFVEPYRLELIWDFKTPGNEGSYVGTVMTDRCVDQTPRVAFWPGKVNQHAERGSWYTDPDGFSGANVNKLLYCRKWYPRTIRVRRYAVETIFDFKEVANRGSHVGTVETFECVIPPER